MNEAHDPDDASLDPENGPIVAPDQNLGKWEAKTYLTMHWVGISTQGDFIAEEAPLPGNRAPFAPASLLSSPDRAAACSEGSSRSVRSRHQ